MRSRLFLVSCVLAMAAPLIYAQDLDPATLYIGTGVSCSGGCSSSGGADPIQFNTTATVDIYQESNGADDLTSGNFGLILAVPVVSGSPTGTPSTTITETDWSDATTKTGTATSVALRQPLTSFDSTSASDIYAALGLTANDSGKWGNLSGGETYAGIKNVQSFTLYEYTVYGSKLVGQGYAQFEFGSDLPLGTYAFGWGINSKPYGTPWTNAGLVADGPPVTPTPEPADAVLLTTMILGCVFLARRRYRFAGRK